MYRSILSLILLVSTLSDGRAQHDLLTAYDWEAVPKMPDAAIVKGESDLILQRHVISQIAEVEDRLYGYELFHMQRYLNDEKAIEAHKTVEISTVGVVELIRLKARVINPNGQVTELGKEAFKTRTDDSGREQGMYFAFEGLLPGSMVEYILLTQDQVNYQGSLVRLQFDVPIRESRYELLAPPGWRFRFKGHNGIPEPALDSSLTDVARYHMVLRDLPGIEHEKSAYPVINRGYLVYKLDAIPEQRLLDISGYSSATRNYHHNMHPELSSRTKKDLAALVKDMKLGFARDEEDRIRTVDMYIRGNFGHTETSSAALGDLEQILRTRTASTFGWNMLYVNVLREAGIEYQMVLTSDRSRSPFDPTFEAHNYLHTLLLYFPAVKKYLQPSEFSLGLGYPSPEYVGTHGLFIRNVDVGGVYGGVGTVKPIAAPPAEATRHDLDLHVRFNEDLTSTTVDVRNELRGYYARYMQVYYAYMNEEDRKKMVGEQLEYLVEGAATENLTAENGEAKLFGVQPFVMRGTVTTPMFTVQAGNDVLLKAGELIGPQMEMYQEKPRKLPIDEDFQRSYDRKIHVHVPEGWSCSDLSSMAIHKSLVIDGTVLAEFRSQATEANGVITIEAMENYNTTHVPLAHFEDWRSVINAAADFNKRTLLLSRR